MATANGSAPTIPNSGVQSEIGTAVDRDRLFTSFDDHRVLSPYVVSPRQIDEMLRQDGKARSIEQALTLPLRGASWEIVPSKGDAGEADWLREALTRNANAGGMSTPIELVISQATSACLYRRAFFEKVFRLDGDKVVYDKIAFRPAGTCRLSYNEQTGAFAGFRQRVPYEHPKADSDGYVTIPPQRAFVFVYGQHRRPIEGMSDMETAFRLFEAKQKVRWLWYVLLENQTMPKAIAKDDNSTDSGNANDLARKVATLKGGGVVGIAQGQSVTPYETSNSAGSAFADCIRFLDAEMYASVLAGFLELASAASLGRGSYALSESQSDFFLQSRQAVLVELATSIENFLLADLVRINFGADAAVPQFKFGSLRAGDVQNAVTLLQSFATSAQTTVPTEFINELTLKVAGYLDLSVDKVAQALQQAPGTTSDPTQAFMQAINHATTLVQQQGLDTPLQTPVQMTEPGPALDLSAFTDRIEQAVRDQPVPNVTVESPQINVTTPDVHVEPHITVERNGAMKIVTDDVGRPVGIEPRDDQ